MITRTKRGLSPVIATVLLVSIALVLAVVIFFWARTFIGENIEKNGQAIELLCDDVNIRAEAYGSKLYVENIGTVPITGVEIRKEQLFGEIERIEVDGDFELGTGESGSSDLDDFNEGDVILVTPILRGETSDERKSFVCDEQYAEEVVVGG